MSSYESSEPYPSLAGLLQPALDAESAPVLAIDTRTGTILAANAGARTLLAIEPRDLPASLDRAMPAVRTLHAIALTDMAHGEPATADLVFWTSRGVVWLAASVERYGDGHGRVVLVRTKTAGERQQPSGGTRDQRTSADEDGTGPVLAPSERDTLREIARRIREGQTAVVEPMTADVGPCDTSKIAQAAGQNTDLDDLETVDSGTIDSGTDAGAPAEAGTGTTPLPASPAGANADDAMERPPSQPDQGSPDGDPPLPQAEEGTDTGPSTSIVPTIAAVPGIDINPDVPTPDALQRAKLAHELKTPIGAIATAAEVMAGARFGALGDPRYRAYADEMLINARHALTLIDRMLARKPAAGKEPSILRIERFDLNELVASSVATIQAPAAAKGVEIGTSLAAGAPRILADETAIRQVLLNLLTNAVKFTPSSGTVSVATLEAPDGGALVRVSDNGPGMPDRDIAAAMRADPESDIRQDRPGGGLGLGLAITRALVEANGAKLEIESRDGEGTTATVRFSGNRLIVA